MTPNIQGLRVAILATDGVEDVEFSKPREALERAQARVTAVSLKTGSIQSMNEDVHPAQTIAIDTDVSADPSRFDALVLPGGTTSPDKLRIDPKAVAFVKHFVDAGKPIAAICHGAWMLIEAGAVNGKTVTSWPSLRTDLTNAGATWVDETFVRDGLIATSRNPKDLPAFCDGMLSLFGDRVRMVA